MTGEEMGVILSGMTADLQIARSFAQLRMPASALPLLARLSESIAKLEAELLRRQEAEIDARDH